MTTQTERKYADEVLTENRGIVRVTRIHPESVLVIHKRKIQAKDIPFNIYTLECSHKGKGIAIKENDTIFCEDCSDSRKVVRSRG